MRWVMDHWFSGPVRLNQPVYESILNALSLIWAHRNGRQSSFSSPASAQRTRFATIQALKPEVLVGIRKNGYILIESSFWVICN